MNTFYMNCAELDKWIHQNRAQYTGDFVDGCLLDNFVLSCKRGFAAVYEHYLNPGQSNYRVEYGVGDAKKVWERWYQFEAAALEERKAG